MVETLKLIMYLEPGNVLHKGFPTILIAIRCIDLVRRNLRKKPYSCTSKILYCCRSGFIANWEVSGIFGACVSAYKLITHASQQNE